MTRETITTQLDIDAFAQVRCLWMRRRSEGWNLEMLMEKLGESDPDYTKKALTSPISFVSLGDTLKTLAKFTEAMNAEIFITVTDRNVSDFKI